MARPTFCRLTLVGDEVRLQSTYDTALIAALKQIPAPQRRWAPTEGCWYLWVQHLSTLERLARRYTIAEVIDGRRVRHLHTGTESVQAEQLDFW